MTVDKVIAKIIWLTFFGPPCITLTYPRDRGHKHVSSDDFLGLR